jgi:hypothetical protein
MYAVYHTGGFIPTRDLARIPEELPFQNRDFFPNVSMPAKFDGSTAGYALHTSMETCLRPEHTREPSSCHTFEFRDWASFMPLTHNWQQPDYRPLHFTEASRQYIKQLGRPPRGTLFVTRV